MAYPYSDNMYSMVDDDSDVDPIDDPLQAQTDQNDQEDPNEQQVLLSPSDGYFRASQQTTSPSAPSSQAQHSWQPSYPPAAASSQVPHVPDVWVADPSLEHGSTAESKAREAREEQEQNRQRFNDRYPALPGNRNITSPTAAGGSIGSNIPSTRSPAHTRSTSSNSFNIGPHHQTSRYTPPSTAATPSRSRRSDTLYSERSSLLSHPNEAPPAYTPSPTSPTSAASPTNYRTFSQSSMGRPEEAQGLLAGHHRPESMADHGDEELYDADPAWRERMKRRVPWFNGRNCRAFLLCLVLLLITVGFLVTMFTSVKQENSNKPINNPGSKQPVQDEPVNDNPENPVGEKPKDDLIRINYPAFDGDVPWNNGRYCSYKKIKLPEESFSLDFSAGRNLSFFQDVDSSSPTEGWDVHVSGEVIIRRAGDGTPDPSIVINGIVNDDRIQIDTVWDSKTQRLELRVPRTIRGDDGHRWPCLQLRVMIWVPENAQLDSLVVENTHLGTLLLDNLSMDIATFTRISAIAGEIIAATDGERDMHELALNGAPASFNFDSRVIEVKSTSGSIAGAWPLYDYLGVESVSGSIKVGIEPKPVSKKSPKPAVLYVKSVSGTIELWEPIHRAVETLAAQSNAQEGLATFTAESIIPPRGYGIEIKGISGSIKGALAFTYSANIHTTSGSIAFDFLPVLDKSLANPKTDKRIDLDTSTTSGTTVIRLLDTMWVDASSGSFLKLPTPPNPPSPPSPPSPPKRKEPPPPVDYIPIYDGDPYDLIGKPSIVTDPFEAETATTKKKKDTGDEPANYARALRCLHSTHSTTSAAVALRYPASWEGDIDVSTMSGSISVKGEGVEVIRKGPDFPGVGKTLLARKGKDGGSVCKVKTLSGSVGVKIGAD